MTTDDKQTPDPTTPALLSASRLAKARAAANAFDDAHAGSSEEQDAAYDAAQFVGPLLRHLAALTAPAVPDGGRLPDLEPQHTPPAERTEGEVWRGRVKVDDDWAHVAVVTADGSTSPVFYWHGQWRGVAKRFGNEVMAAWALAQLAAGRSEGEAERAQMASNLAGATRAAKVNGEELIKACDEIADRDAEIARLTAERDALAAELAEARDEAEKNRRAVVKVAQAGTIDTAAARRDGAREERARWQDICADLAANPEHERTAMIAVGRARLDETRRARGEGQGS
jgi:chorismate mutase